MRRQGRGARREGFLKTAGAGTSRAIPAQQARGSILIVDDELGLADLMSEILPLLRASCPRGVSSSATVL
jgi:hypothetical protein